MSHKNLKIFIIFTWSHARLRGKNSISQPHPCLMTHDTGIPSLTIEIEIDVLSHERQARSFCNRHITENCTFAVAEQTPFSEKLVSTSSALINWLNCFFSGVVGMQLIIINRFCGFGNCIFRCSDEDVSLVSQELVFISPVDSLRYLERSPVAIEHLLPENRHKQIDNKMGSTFQHKS